MFIIEIEAIIGD